MTPQSAFMVVAPITQGRIGELRALLETMTGNPGIALPDNSLVPFYLFDRLHVARFIILEAHSEPGVEGEGPEPSHWPAKLAFLGDCDGPADTFIAELAVKASPGLGKIFSHCDGFIDSGENLVAWMQQNNIQPKANYINWLGRTLVQIREENALHQALSKQLRMLVTEQGRDDPRELRQALLSFVEIEQHTGRLSLTPAIQTPTVWYLKNLLHKLGVPLLLLLMAPVFLLIAPYVLIRLRLLEGSDPELLTQADPQKVRELASLEDHDITNQFSAFGVVKPQPFRRYLVRFLLWLLDYSARHVYKRGFLTRVETIHFARWVLLDNNRRLFFASNYDGSLESYMDDFINKVAWGLNLVFSNGVGYPSTRWLIKKGAEQEQKFKNYLRRRQLPTEVWYKAYPDQTAFDLARNSRIREGVESRQSNDQEIRKWLALIGA
ncbi:MAG: hypothetical protein V7739_20730 [Motiliproteus sp.]